jgi:outer membrane lipoprotein-sorting protein
MPTRRLWAIVAAVAALGIMGGVAQATINGSGSKPPAKALDQAVLDAVRAPHVAGITARISFSDNLLPSGSLPQGSSSPLLAGAKGRLWLAGDGRLRLELQSDAGDAQITSDGHRLNVYDAGSNTVYRFELPAERDTSKQHANPTLAGVRRALDALSKTWTLSGATPTSTAGRPSYTVRISPKDDGGLLGAAEVAWDAEHGVPLRAAVYAQGQSDPVLELKATDISFGAVSSSDVNAPPPANAKVVDVGPLGVSAAGNGRKQVHGVAAVAKQLDFPLAAPAELAGLPRKDVRLVRVGEQNAALVTYGEGLGAIAVLEHKTDGSRTALDRLRLPQINIDGATGSEVGTALGTVLTFDRGGVSYLVAGSVPPVAEENAARGLR